MSRIMRFTEEGNYERVFEARIKNKGDADKFQKELDAELIQAKHFQKEVVVDIWRLLPKK